MIINLVLCCDDKFVMPTLVCLTSVFENNKRHSFVVYIVTAGISKQNEEKIHRLSATYNHTILITRIDTARFTGLRARGRLVVATYYRFILPEIIDGDKVLYLDGDIIVTSDLGELWTINLDGHACAIVEDQKCSDIKLFNRLYLQSVYFNAGVMLVNLDYWRQHNITKELFTYASENNKLLVLQDQDALNVVLSGHIIYINYTYNFQNGWYGNTKTNTAHFSKWGELNRIKNSPVIIHYNNLEKPWYVECTHPLKNVWKQYGELHDFIGYRETRLYSMWYKIAVRLIYGVGMRVLKKLHP